MKAKARSAVAQPKTKERIPQPKSWSGSQTLLRGLDVLEAVGSGATKLSDLASMLELNRSTTHRLARTLVARRYLIFTPRNGYGLGNKTLELVIRPECSSIFRV